MPPLLHVLQNILHVPKNKLHITQPILDAPQPILDVPLPILNVILPSLDIPRIVLQNCYTPAFCLVHKHGHVLLEDWLPLIHTFIELSIAENLTLFLFLIYSWKKMKPSIIWLICLCFNNNRFVVLLFIQEYNSTCKDKTTIFSKMIKPRHRKLALLALPMSHNDWELWEINLNVHRIFWNQNHVFYV